MRRGGRYRIVVRKTKYRGWGVFDEFDYVPEVRGYSRCAFTARRWETALEYAFALYQNDVNAMYAIRLKEASLCRGFR
jgi:hypothetical protein